MTGTMSLIAAALALGSVAAPTVTNAQRYGDDEGGRYAQPYRGGYEGRPGYGGGDARGWDRRYGDGRGWDDRGYGQPGWDARGYRGYDARYDDRGYGRRCSGGTTGAIVGALAGGLLGRTIDGHGDRAVGTLLGAGGGALAGRAIERSNNPGYCR